MGKPLNPATTVESLGAPQTEPLPEVSKVTAIASAAGLNSKYFTLHDGSDNAFYVWFNRATAGSDPAPGGTGIEVAIGASDTAVQVAAAIQAAVDAVAAFLAVLDGAVVQITNAVDGAATDIGAGNSTLTVSVEKQGHAGDYYPSLNPASISNNPSA